jgi:quercetin dioxygenase-like cupin family protein
MNENFFPEIIRKLPKPNIPVEGLESFLFQGENQQILFMEFENNVEIAEHSHEAQWGVVLEGEIELKIKGKLHVLKKGDTYFIPAEAIHSAQIKAGYKDITLFNQKNRYQTQK